MIWRLLAIVRGIGVKVAVEFGVPFGVSVGRVGVYPSVPSLHVLSLASLVGVVAWACPNLT